MRRVFVLVLDSLGVGSLPDAARFGDEGAHTLDHLIEAAGGLEVPRLSAAGLGCITRPHDGRGDLGAPEHPCNGQLGHAARAPRLRGDLLQAPHHRDALAEVLIGEQTKTFMQLGIEYDVEAIATEGLVAVRRRAKQRAEEEMKRIMIAAPRSRKSRRKLLRRQRLLNSRTT